MGLEKLYKRLQLTDNDSLILLSDENWRSKVSFPSRVMRIIENSEILKPEAIFCIDNKPLILFFENPTDKTALHKAIWNFNESPIVIITENDLVTIYNGFDIVNNSDFLKQIGGDEILNDFTYFELVTGKTFDKYKEEFDYKKRVDYKLLNNIEAAQTELCTEYSCSNDIANAILGKIIFIRYLIDRKVRLNYDGTSRIWTNDEFVQLFDNRAEVFRFFQYLQDKENGFNGDLFPIDQESYEKIPDNAFSVIKRLLEGEEIKTGQKSLFNLYDFSILPVEFISNVYEKFIGKENQADKGAYYTPTFLVDYIISQTVAKRLEADNNNTSCKVLDPACGSGIFLVESLRRIIDKHIRINNNQNISKEELKKIATDNIFGIDEDKNAIQVAIFSVYLTLLDYQQPAEIENFKFPTMLNTNFFDADFFDTERTYNEELKKHSFDFILGNPPWGGDKKGLDNIGNDYIEKRKSKEKELKKQFSIGINNNEIAEGFMLRASDFCSLTTQIALIIKSSILYNLGYSDVSPFRPYWLQEFFIDQVFELAPVRYEVFERSNDPALAPAAIIFYRYSFGENTYHNLVEHITLLPSSFFSKFKIFTINRANYQRIIQSVLKEHDWLWKTLVYGSYLDFNFIKRLKEEYPTVKNILSDNTRFLEGTGIQYSSNPKDNSEHYLGKPLISAYGVEHFYINPDKIKLFDKIMVHRIRDPRLFIAPMLLIRKGIDMDSFTAKCAISKDNILFKDSLTSIKCIDSNLNDILYDMIAIFNSKIYAYFAINTFANIGIEREQTYNYDKFSVPYVDFNFNITKDIERIEQIQKELHETKKNDVNNQSEIEKLENDYISELNKINNIIFDVLRLSETDKVLIDYALTVNKQIIVGDEHEKAELFSHIKFKDQLLENYAQLYIDRFAPSLSTDGNRFIVEIWHTNQIIGMFFKVIPDDEFTEEIVFEDKQNDSAIIKKLFSLGVEQITEQLFVQKDIRGFDNDSFYIFKPNEKRLWHKAIGYLDVNEFDDAILRAGRDSL